MLEFNQPGNKLNYSFVFWASGWGARSCASEGKEEAAELVSKRIRAPLSTFWHHVRSRARRAARRVASRRVARRFLQKEKFQAEGENCS